VNHIFKALNDESRRKILELLHGGDLSAGAIAAHFDMSAPSISHHLDILKQASLVQTTKEGQFVYYSLNTTVVDELMAWLIQFKSKKRAK
jgi:DNA-binding transcriptional ArsR family regulator